MRVICWIDYSTNYYSLFAIPLFLFAIHYSLIQPFLFVSLFTVYYFTLQSPT